MRDGDVIGALTAKVDELARVCARLSRENAELRGQVLALSEPAVPPGPAGRAAEGAPAARISRRAAVGVALAGAAAGIAGVGALTERGGAHPAAGAEAAELTAAEVPDIAAPTATGSVVSASLSTISAVVAAANANAGPGVHGTSAAGRGGIFGGAAAQIQLTPAGKTHPRSGQRGDLFADAAGRLWYCKTTGATATWHQIA